MSRRVVAGVLIAALVAAGGMGLLSLRGEEDPFEAYCAEVEEQRGPLGETLAQGPETGLIAALPVFRELMEKSPEDLIDEWSTVIAHVEALAEAVDAAGVDPATYDRENLPAEVTPAEREAIDSAATALGSDVMRRSLAGVQQHARDVCGTPLSL